MCGDVRVGRRGRHSESIFFGGVVRLPLIEQEFEPGEQVSDVEGTVFHEVDDLIGVMRDAEDAPVPDVEFATQGQPFM